MHIIEQDKALRDAGAALTKAIQALHDVKAYELSEDALRLANRVLLARRALVVAR